MRLAFDVLDGRVVHATVDGIPVSFERRRYGRAQFYCWAFAYIDGLWLEFSRDPWPCARPKTSELAEALARFTAERTASLRAAIAQHSEP